MCFRFFYAICETWRFKAQLKQYMQTPVLQLVNIQDISKYELDARGVSVLVLDFDAVLAAHGEPQPKPEIIVWLRQFSKMFQPGKIYILSNKPTAGRQEFFLQNFPEIKFIFAKRKKPYPDGLLQIAADAGAHPQQLLLVDDRLCTGILATLIAGTQGLWITKPYVNIMARPIVERWFIFLRWSEQLIIKYFL
jgi:predicted HAD superfamily phosphohydrolase YqeG